MPTLKRLINLALKPDVVRIGGIALHTRSPIISDRMRRKLLTDNYEKEERFVVERIVKPGSAVLEFGAGLGYLAAVCAKIAGSGNVVTVEANPRLESLIRSNFALNGVSPTLLIGAAGREDGESELFTAEDFWSSTTVQGLNNKGVEKIRVYDANALIQRYRPTVLICDIEGGEAELLPALDLKGVASILIELHPKKIGFEVCSDLVESLLQRGFYLDLMNTQGGSATFHRRQH